MRLGLGKKRAATFTPDPPATNLPIGGGWVRTNTNFLSGKTIKNVTTDFGSNNLDKLGISDNQAKINAIIASLSASNIALYFPAGVYLHSGTISISGKIGWVVYGDGWITELRATDKTASTLFLISCSAPRVSDLWLSCPSGSSRYDIGNNRRGMNVISCTNYVIDNVKVSGVENAGMLFEGCSLGSTTYSTIDHNFSDNFHHTTGCANITVQYCLTNGGGDDSYASIGAGSGNTNISFLDNISLDSGARGISFEATNGGTALRNQIFRSSSAGMAIDSPSSYPGTVDDNITAQYNYFEGVKTGSVGHPAILIFAQAAYTHGVIFSDNTIKDPVAADFFQIFGTSSSLDVVATLQNNVMLHTGTKNAWNVGSFTTLTRTGNTKNGAAANS
jgi:hypothetical protein